MNLSRTVLKILSKAYSSLPNKSEYDTVDMLAGKITEEVKLPLPLDEQDELVNRMQVALAENLKPENSYRVDDLYDCDYTTEDINSRAMPSTPVLTPSQIATPPVQQARRAILNHPGITPSQLFGPPAQEAVAGVPDVPELPEFCLGWVMVP